MRTLMRLLHIADVHLDTPFAGRSEALRLRLRAATRTAFARAVDCALHEGVHALVVAGDLFDGDRLSFASEAFLLEQLVRLRHAGILVVYATGNHDPASQERRSIAWPPNVVVMDRAEPQRVPVETAEGKRVGFVTGAGHVDRGETRDLASSFPEPEGALPEVAVLHSQVHGASGWEAHHRYAPSSLQHLIASGYHYWALGHVHTRQVLHDAPAVCYAGNPQGRTPQERGPRGGLLVDLSEPALPAVEFRAFGPIRFETLEVTDLAGAGSPADLVDGVRAAWEAARTGDRWAEGREWIVRVVMSGPSPLWRELGEEEERATLNDQLRDALGALDVDLWAHGVHPVVDPEEHRNRRDVLGEALRIVEALRSGEDALEVDPDELADPPGDADALPEYLKDLLEHGEAEILSRMLRHGEL